MKLKSSYSDRLYETGVFLIRLRRAPIRSILMHFWSKMPKGTSVQLTIMTIVNWALVPFGILDQIHQNQLFWSTPKPDLKNSGLLPAITTEFYLPRNTVLSGSQLVVVTFFTFYLMSFAFHVILKVFVSLVTGKFWENGKPTLPQPH